MIPLPDEVRRMSEPLHRSIEPKKGDYLLMPFAGPKLDNLIRVIGLSNGRFYVRHWYQEGSSLCASWKPQPRSHWKKPRKS